MNKLEELEYFIPENVPSLKNSKIKTSRGIFPSKTVVKYLRTLGIKHYSSKNKIVSGYTNKPNLFKQALIDFPKLHEKDYPILLGFHFVRRTKLDFDFNNATQIVQDLLVAHNFIIDDNMRYLLPYPYQKNNKYYTIDKENPGVFLKLKLNGCRRKGKTPKIIP